MLLGEEIVRRIGPVEQVRLVSSGTEATMSAIRLARGFTGRTMLVKFAGCYHGHVDALLAAAGSGVATLALPDSAGVTGGHRGRGVRPAVQRHRSCASRFRGRIPARSPRSSPRRHRPTWAWCRRVPGFNGALAAVAHEHGALLISDEVMTGFRVSPAGMFGLDGALEGWQPDLLTFGKVIGGGLPVGAFGGRAT